MSDQHFTMLQVSIYRPVDLPGFRLTSQHSFSWHNFSKLNNSPLVRPCQNSIVIFTLVFRAPTGAGFRLALKARIRSTENRLPQIVEAMSRVVSKFLS
jgi:hypothetical protein